MTTWTTAAALGSHGVVYSLEIEGIGRRINCNAAGASSSPYRLTSLAITGDSAGTLVEDRIIPAISSLPGTQSERLDLVGGTTDISTLSISLRLAADADDLTIADQGWTDLQDMLGVHQAAVEWELAANCIAGDLVLTLVSRAGIAVGDALWIGAETIVVTALGPGAQQITVTRATHGTQDRAHAMAPNGDGYLYDRPRYLKGRRCLLYVSLLDPAYTDGLTICPIGGEAVAYSGLFEDWRITNPGEIELSLRSILAMINRRIGVGAFSGQTTLASAGGADRADILGPEFQPPYPLEIYPMAGPSNEQAAPLLWPASGVTPAGHNYVFLHAQIGDYMAEIEVILNLAGDGFYRAYVLDWQVCGAKPSDGGSSETMQVHEILISDPTPRQIYPPGMIPLARFKVAASATDHPADIALCILTSTGTAGLSGSWDCLPIHWSCSILQTELDMISWRRLRTETAEVHAPRMLLGRDGDPSRVREEIVDQLFAPLGWFIRPTIAGTLGVARIRDVYPQDTVLTISTTMFVPGSLKMAGQLQSSVSSCTFKYDYDHGAKEYRITRTVQPVVARDRLQDDDSDQTFECPALAHTAGGDDLIAARSNYLSKWWASPYPRVDLAVLLRYGRAIILGDMVELGAIPWPDMMGGDKLLTGTLGIVVERRINYQSAVVELGIQLIPAANVAHWAPSATITLWTPATLTATVNQHDYTGEEEGWGDGADAERFIPGDLVGLYDLRGVPRAATSATVQSVTATTVVVDAGWAPTVPAAKDIIRFVRYSGGTAPQAAWTANMKQYVAQAEAGGTLGGTADPAYVYGT